MFTKQVLVAGLALGAGACSTGSSDALAVADQAISNVPGIDVSQFQGAINWSTLNANRDQCLLAIGLRLAFSTPGVLGLLALNRYCVRAIDQPRLLRRCAGCRRRPSRSAPRRSAPSTIEGSAIGHR